jgi:hypothetical protein
VVIVYVAFVDVVQFEFARITESRGGKIQA